jgi:hypothetical protein
MCFRRIVALVFAASVLAATASADPPATPPAAPSPAAPVDLIDGVSLADVRVIAADAGVGVYPLPGPCFAHDTRPQTRRRSSLCALSIEMRPSRRRAAGRLNTGPRPSA